MFCLLFYVGFLYFYFLFINYIQFNSYLPLLREVRNNLFIFLYYLSVIFISKIRYRGKINSFICCSCCIIFILQKTFLQIIYILFRVRINNLIQFLFLTFLSYNIINFLFLKIVNFLFFHTNIFYLPTTFEIFLYCGIWIFINIWYLSFFNLMIQDKFYRIYLFLLMILLIIFFIIF